MWREVKTLEATWEITVASALHSHDKGINVASEGTCRGCTPHYRDLLCDIRVNSFQRCVLLVREGGGGPLCLPVNQADILSVLMSALVNTIHLFTCASSLV